jgi:hypothetical protein
MSAIATNPPVESVVVRITDVLRDIARGGVAGAVAGVVVGGLGGRLVMTIAALLSPGATGLRTENGELVGVFTVQGTLALFLFGGMFAGFLAGVVWVVVSPWIPWSGPRRWLLAMPLAVALGGFFLVQSTNRDFQILDSVGPIVVMLLVLVALIGAATAWLDERLERWLPRPGRRRIGPLVLYGAIGALGAPAFVLAISAYFSRGFGPADPPERVGYALLASGLATALWWATRIATGRLHKPSALLATGRIGLGAAVIFGAAQLLPEVTSILSRS